VKKILIFLFILSLYSFCEDIYKFDFGPEGQVIMNGFTGITPDTKFTEEKGYGWITEKDKLYGIDRKKPEPLGCDFIISKEGNFRIKVPNGEYKIWILFGDSTAGSTVYPIYSFVDAVNPLDREIIINNSSVFKDYITWQRFYSEEFFYENLNSDYKRGDNIWDKYLTKKFNEKIYKVNVEDGKIEIKIKNIPLNGLIIYPVSLANRGEAEINFVNKLRKRKALIEEIKPVLDNPPMPKISKEDENRGYLIFSQNWWELVYPETIPKEENIGKGINLWLSKGEVKTGMFGIFPLRDIKGIEIKATDLKNEKGDIIKASQIEIRKVRYIEKNISGNQPGYKYIVIPHLLVPTDKIDIEKGITRAIFITVKIPEEAKEGNYKGNIEIKSEKNITKIPLTVKVLPIKLQENDIAYGIYDSTLDYYWYYYWTGVFKEKEFEDEILKHKERRYKFLRDYGLTTIAIGEDLRRWISSPDGKTITINFENTGFTHLMDIATKVGFNPIVWYGFQGLWRTSRGPEKPYLIKGFENVEPLSDLWKEGYKKSIELVRDEGKKRNWSEIIFYIEDEASNVGKIGAEYAREVAKVAKEVPGIKTIASVNGPYEKILAPYLSIICPNSAFPITEENLNYIRECGTELWVYNIGTSRFSSGFYLWKIGAKGRLQWSGSVSCSPYDDFDGAHPETSYMYYYSRPNDYPVATLYLEKMREGIYDYRYIKTLEKAIERCKNIKKPEAEKVIKDAENLLEEIKNKIDVDIRKYFKTQVRPEEVGGDVKEWTEELCEKYRWMIASKIIELNKLIEK
jgi:hypothetical protein